MDFRKKLRSMLYKTPLLFIPKIKKEYLKDQQKANEFTTEKREAFASLYRNSLIEFYKKNRFIFSNAAVKFVKNKFLSQFKFQTLINAFQI